MSSYETYKGSRARTHELAVNEFRHHVITEEAPKVWRCGKPDTVIFSFRVAELPGAILIWGDIGTMVIDAGRNYTIAWLKGAAKSRQYLLEKSSTARLSRTFYEGDFKEWATEQIASQDLDSDHELIEALSELNGDYSRVGLDQIVEATGDTELCCMFEGPSPQIDLLCEALEWFVANLSQ